MRDEMLSYSPGIGIFIFILVMVAGLFGIICRWRIFQRMGLRPWFSLIPILSEYKIFKRCWKVWPFIVLFILFIVFSQIVSATSYMDIYLPIPTYVKENFWILAIVCVIAIKVMMYKHMAFVFGHDIGFLMGLLFLNPIFIGIMAFSKNTFHEELARMTRKELREYTRTNRTLANKLISTVSAMVILFTSIGYIGYVMMTEQQPPFLVLNHLNEVYSTTAEKVSGRGKVIYPALEDGVIDTPGVREYYYPDKSDVDETTVYMYIIGSDLEDSSGSASINLSQIVDATKAGSDLKFIVEAGGSGRWFTDGIKDRKTGRYVIQNGKIKTVEILPSNTCMSRQETLTDFLKWANRKYPSDRRMLFFWDHGGGLSGFGVDKLNPKKYDNLLSMSDICASLKASGEQYDVIAFDACLMQTMEVGQCMEPYADYLLASEESEPSSGMYYTAAFSRLAAEPDLDTLKFGAMMCSSYDQSLELLNGGTPQAGYTLSMTDLRYIPVVQETIIGYLDELDEKFRTDHGSFVSMSTARNKAYEFQMEDQIDLIDFLYQSDLSAADKNQMISKIKKSIVVRNAASADHIGGLAMYMPYDNLPGYTDVYETMKELDMKSETKVYNDFASILCGQKTSRNGGDERYLQYSDWYVKDFKNYNNSLSWQDIPLTRSGTGYKINLREESWDTIISCEQGLRIKVGDRYADLGTRTLEEVDDEGHYKLTFDRKWVAINGVPVALHPGKSRIEKDGTTVYTGTVDATINFMTPITIYIEWTDSDKEGRILGYLPENEDSDDIAETGMPRGFKLFKSTNIVTFLYDWYDEDGNYISTASGHLPMLVGTVGLRVKMKDVSHESYMYCGILQDAMHRVMRTETLKHNEK